MDYMPRMRCIMSADGPISHEAYFKSLSPAERMIVFHAAIFHICISPSKIKTEGLMREAGSYQNGFNIANAVLNNQDASGYSAHDYWNAIQRVFEFAPYIDSPKLVACIREKFTIEEDPQNLAHFLLDIIMKMTRKALVDEFCRKDLYLIESFVLFFQLGKRVSFYHKENLMPTRNVAMVISGNLLTLLNLLEDVSPEKPLSSAEMRANFLHATLIQTRLQNTVQYILENHDLDIDLRELVDEQLTDREFVEQYCSEIPTTLTTQRALKDSHTAQLLAQADDEILQLTEKFRQQCSFYDSYQKARPSMRTLAQKEDPSRIKSETEYSFLQINLYKELKKTREALEDAKRERKSIG